MKKKKDKCLLKKWYVVVNDLIGGYCICTEDVKFCSEVETRSGVNYVGEFLTKEMAEHIVKIHNKWLSVDYANALSFAKSIKRIHQDRLKNGKE